jgi:hypothetical protein
MMMEMVIKESDVWSELLLQASYGVSHQTTVLETVSTCLDTNEIRSAYNFAVAAAKPTPKPSPHINYHP